MIERTIEMHEDVAALNGKTFTSARLIFPNPMAGGPSLAHIRAVLGQKHRLRFTATPAKLFVDVDEGSAAGLIALDMIVRSDAQGLQRAILSALPFVDEIVIGVDARSDAETVQVAKCYADLVWKFDAEDLKFSQAQWQANAMDFAGARNLGRQKVRCPWVLVLDSDEVLRAEETDLRLVVAEAKPEITSFGFSVTIDGNHLRDSQRLARSEYRWERPAHNILMKPEGGSVDVSVHILHDTSLRAPKEVERRTKQREKGIELLEQEAKEGDLNAMFHVAKHRLSEFDIEKAKYWVELFRKRVMPWSEGSEERAHLATSMAVLCYKEKDFIEAELWAFRALLDGPYLDALCLLGDLAEERGSLKAARVWYEAACVTDPAKYVGLTTTVQMRHGRLAFIKAALGIA